MSDLEQDHAALVKAGRLEWLEQTMTVLRAREAVDPASVPAFAVLAIHSAVASWARLLDLEVPA